MSHEGNVLVSGASLLWSAESEIEDCFHYNVICSLGFRLTVYIHLSIILSFWNRGSCSMSVQLWCLRSTHYSDFCSLVFLFLADVKADLLSWRGGKLTNEEAQAEADKRIFKLN